MEKVLACAIATRNFEIAQLSTRNNFALVTQGALIAAALSKGVRIENVSFLIIAALGATLSLFQLHMAAGAKFWQAHWEAVTEDAERRYMHALKIAGIWDVVTLFSGENVKSVVEAHLNPIMRSTTRLKSFENSLILKQYSPSRTPLRMALSCLIVWFALFVFAAAINAVNLVLQEPIAKIP